MKSTAVAGAIALAALACTHQPKPARDGESPPRQSTGAGADDMSGVKIERTAVAGHVYMLTGRGGNIGVSAGDSGILIIDDQFAPLAPKIRDEIAGLGSGKIEFVINTHWHGDHTGGNPIFGAGAKIIAHTNVRKRLSETQNVRGRVIPPLPDDGLPVITFDDSVTLHFNGEEIHVLHLPHGHTDGDSIVYFVGSNVVHMGDHFFNGKFPLVDTATGGDPLQYEKNVARALEMIPADAKIIPGHGPLGTVADLRTFHQMLVETTAAVREQKQAGKALAEVRLDPKWDSWGTGFISTDSWIATLYGSL